MGNFGVKHIVMVLLGFGLLGAIAWLKRADNSVLAETTISVGQEEYKKGRYASAVRKFNEALAFDEENYKAYFSRGLCYQEMGESLKAYQDYTKSIKYSPSSDRSNLYLLRGKLLVTIGKQDEGCRDLKKAKELGSSKAAPVLEKFCN